MILCVGVDTRRAVEQQKGLRRGRAGRCDGPSDTEPGDREVNILTIPRDTMTEIRLFDLNGNYLGTDVQHLTAYGYGDGEQESCELLTEAVENLLGGVEIDGYVSVNMSAIPVLNDMVGGVTVTIDDPALSQRLRPSLWRDRYPSRKTGRDLCALQRHQCLPERYHKNGPPQDLREGMDGTG